MPKHDFSDLDVHYPAIIAQMPDTFTSHQFILKLAQEHQDLYVEALYAYRDSIHRGRPTPFCVVHGILSKRLNGHRDIVQREGDERESQDIFGQANHCARWRKV